MAQFNVNLHPSYFQQQLPPQPERRTIDSVEYDRSIPIDLKVTPRKNYNLYSEKNKSSGYAQQAVKGIHQETELSKLFFSRENVDNLQNMIRYSVFVDSGGKFDPTSGRPIKETGHIVGKQAEHELFVFMRYIYLQYGRFPAQCTQQVLNAEVNRLNGLVLKEAVPDVLEEVEGHLGYLRDASRNPPPIPRPLASSNAGTRVLRSTTEVLGAEF